MRPAARLASFAALLAVVFAGAALAGSALDPDADTAGGGHAGAEPHAAEPGTGAAGSTAGGHAGHTPAPAQAVKGLAVTEGGFTLALSRRELPARRRAALRLRILRLDGSPLRRFDVEHEKRMHLIVVRRDGSGFQHLHPRMAADGTWTTPIRVHEPGAHRVFADFATGGRALTLGADLTVDGSARYRPLPEPADVADAGNGLQVRLDDGGIRAGADSTLSFTVQRDGAPVHTEPYLGAGGHLVALRESDLAYLHTHPAGHAEGGAHGDDHDDGVAFETQLPSPGRYRLYLQFRVDGRVHTAEFTREVNR